MKKTETCDSNTTPIEWAQLTPNKLVIATKDKAWLHPPNFAKNRYAHPMTGKGNMATTRKLLDGAIAAAKKTVKLNKKQQFSETSSLICQLASAYHLSRAASELMEEADVGFSMIGRWELAEWAAQKANKEEGRDLLILNDIQSLGYHPEAVVKALVSFTTKALIDYCTRIVRDWNPIDCVGYSYAMERSATNIIQKLLRETELSTIQEASAVIHNLHLHTIATKNIKRAEETVQLVAELPAKERIRIAVACYETALIYTSPQEDDVSDKELQQILEPLKLTSKVPS